MAKIVVVDVGDGRKVLIGGSEQASGLRETSKADHIVKASKEQFDKAMDMLGEIIAKLEGTVQLIPNKPSKVEIEFGVSLSGECDLWIVSGEGKSEFKVKMVWEQKDQKQKEEKKK